MGGRQHIIWQFFPRNLYEHAIRLPPPPPPQSANDLLFTNVLSYHLKRFSVTNLEVLSGGAKSIISPKFRLKLHSIKIIINDYKSDDKITVNSPKSKENPLHLSSRCFGRVIHFSVLFSFEAILNFLQVKSKINLQASIPVECVPPMSGEGGGMGTHPAWIIPSPRTYPSPLCTYSPAPDIPTDIPTPRVTRNAMQHQLYC